VAELTPTDRGFAACRLGHEFTSLVLALLHVSGNPPRIDAALTAAHPRMAPVARAAYVHVAVVHSCPDVVQAIDLIARSTTASSTR
jgi:alkyl hydroperoxide reductase subunit F